MSIVAKVFVVLNLVLTAGFFYVSMTFWATRAKWQKMYELEKARHIEDKEVAAEKVRELREKMLGQDEEIRLAKQRIETQETRIKDLTEQKGAAEMKLFVAEQQRERLQTQLEEATRENGRRAQQIEKMHIIIAKQQAAVATARANETQARNEKTEIENELNATREQLVALQKDKRRIEEDYALLSRKMEALMERGVPVAEILQDQPEVTQKDIPGVLVLAVKPEVGMVMLSAGEEQGVKTGYRFSIIRGDKYVGKVQVEKVYNNMCSARILPGTKDEIREHDEARSR